MMDKMNQTAVGNDWLESVNQVFVELGKLLDGCVANDKDNMEFIIMLTYSQRDKLKELLTAVMNP